MLRLTEHGGQGLGSIEEVEGRNSIAPLSVQVDIGEGLLESRHNSGAFGERSRHVGYWEFGEGIRERSNRKTKLSWC